MVCSRLSFLATLLVASTAAATPPDSVTVLNFDDAEVPCTFAEAPSLSDQYMTSGVMFSGGMEVLNECGNFGIVEHSSRAFLGWNTSSTGTSPPETLTFSAPVSNFRFLTGSLVDGTVTATAFDHDGQVLATQTITLTRSAMPMALEVDQIAKVVISSTAQYGAIDDIRFNR